VRSKSNAKSFYSEQSRTQEELSLIEGYKVMSRINLSLANDAVQSDNEAQTLAEQKLAECE